MIRTSIVGHERSFNSSLVLNGDPQRYANWLESFSKHDSIPVPFLVFHVIPATDQYFEPVIIPIALIRGSLMAN